jgi:hypothetical protein
LQRVVDDVQPVNHLVEAGRAPAPRQPVERHAARLEVAEDAPRELPIEPPGRRVLLIEARELRADLAAVAVELIEVALDRGVIGE